MRYEPELYFKSPDEMRKIFCDFPDAITNTLEIADRCNLEIEFGKSKYPEYPVPEGKTRDGYLCELCYKGLSERYGERAERDRELIKRLDSDIDVDFCEARRGEVLEYVRQKYGERRVAQIITFGRLKARSVVRDVARVMGLSVRDGDRIAKMIPNELNITLSSAAERNPELKRAVATELQTKQLMQHAMALEGLSRSAGVHAAGVVISDRDLAEYVPLCRDVKGNDIVSQYSMNPLNDLGLLKMDFLGLKTLTVIEDTANLIRKTQPKFEIKDIPLNDQKAFDLYNRGETIGLFQMESGGITSVSKQFDVRKLDDIIALIALYRPGPMELIGDYIKRKNGPPKIRYEHPRLE